MILKEVMPIGSIVEYNLKLSLMDLQNPNSYNDGLRVEKSTVEP